MRVLVTGGAGFIGSHLAAELARLGHSVRVIDNFSTGRRSNLEALAPDADLVEGDIRSYERAATAVRGCDGVFHLAAVPSVPRSVQDPLTTHEANVTGLLNVMLAARDAGIRRLVYASSSSVYGAGESLPKREDQQPLPISPYGVSKLAGEGYCRAFRDVYGLETVALRYFNVFGPYQDPSSGYAAAIPKFIASLLAGQPPVIFGDGEQSRDFTYVEDVVRANVLAMDAPSASGRVYNVARGERITLNELIAMLRELTGSSVDAIYDGPRAGEVRHSLADISAARRDLGYEPLVPLREGLRRTVEHLVDAAEAEAAISG